MRATPTMPDIRELELFDTCVTLGRSCVAGVPQWLSAGNVLETMDKHDIAEAFVHSNEARLVHPRRRGNERLLADIAGIERLHPVWVLIPPAKPDPLGCRRMVDEMVSAGVRAARLMMGHVPPLHWIWKDLCEALEARRVVCSLDFAGLQTPTTMSAPDAQTLDRLLEVCTAHQDMPMVLSHHCGGLGLSPAMLPLLHRTKNVLMDITSVVDYWRRVARDLGPERVVFATGMPFVDPATFISNVQYDENLSLDAKRLICGGNIRQLLAAVG